MTAVTISELSGSEDDLARLTAFYQTLFIDGFPDPDERESLENMQAYLKAKQAGWYSSRGPKNNYHIVLAEREGRAVAAAVCDYLAVPNSGIIEFLLVAESVRGQGWGRRMHDAVEVILHQDAVDAGYERLDGITIEMNDPYRVDIASDNMDPFVRARLWGRWGYSVFEFPYVQPALSDEQAPVTCLLLCFKRTSSRWKDSVSSEVVRQVVHGYLQWAMRIEDLEQDPVFQEMSRALSALPDVKLTSLQAYVGEDPARPFEIVPLTDPASELFREAMEVYQQSFPRGETTISPSAIAETLRRLGSGQAGCRYHLWGVRNPATGRLRGMASFFTLPHAGFAGYITLIREFARTGRCRLLLARIEEQLVGDQPGLTGWFLECEPDSSQFQIFSRLGFAPVPIDYRQPSLTRIDPLANSATDETRLALMRKTVGLPMTGRAATDDLLPAQVAEIMQHVYRMPDSTARDAARRMVP